MTRILVGFSRFSESSSLSPYFGPFIKGFIQHTHVVLSVAVVSVLEPAHGQIFRHLWSTWWSGFWLDFRVFGILDLSQDFARGTYLQPSRGNLGQQFTARIQVGIA